MVSTRVLLRLICLVVMPGCVFGQVTRSNGKGGGLWSNPATWEGGKVPTAGEVSVLGKDVVDLDPAAGSALNLDEIVIDARGALRVVGTNKTSVTITLKRALRVFGGLIVDFSKDPEGRCEFQWTVADGVASEFLVNELCKVQLKGAPGPTSNVAFRIMTPTNLPPNAPAFKPTPILITSKVWIEAESVAFDGFALDVRGVDGSGMKYNERCLFQGCQFLRSFVSLQQCTKIGFERNLIQDSPYPYGTLNLHGVYHSRFVSNLLLRANQAGISCYGVGNSEFVGNTMRSCPDGAVFTACSDLFINQNLIEGSRQGLLINSCGRMTGARNTYASSTWVNIRAVHSGKHDSWRFFEENFKDAPTNANTACLSVETQAAIELVNVPMVSFLKDGERGALILSAYVDILVTNEQGAPLGRVPLRVLAGNEVVATGRTEAVGARTGYTPLPSTHRPLIVPWFRFAPPGDVNPATSRQYTLEVDGTRLGYTKQNVPLVVDATFVRTDPDKPTKTVTVKLPKAP